MNESEFQATVLKGVETQAAESKALATKFDDLQTQTKTAIGELGALKSVANSQAEIIAKIQRAQLALDSDPARRTRDPIARFCESEARREWLVGSFKKAMGLGLTPAQKTAVTAVDSGIGGAVTPQEVNAMIYDALLSYGQWNTLGVVPVGAKTQIVPLISARPTAYWVAQGAQITEGAFTGTSVTLTVKEAAAWIPVARALLEDAEGDFAGYVLQQLAEAVSYRLDWACFAADGTDDTTDGAFTGIASGGTAATAANGNTTVAALDLEDFVRCLTTVSAGVLQRPARWWIHPTVLAKICQIRDSNGRSIFQTANDAPAPGAIGSILGYPVIVTAAMPSTDSAGQVVACFGDPQGAAVGVRKSFELATSDDFQFDYNRRAFRVIVRAGFIIKLATSFAKLTTAAA
jgi:HK97 family phage major capsid protein